MDRQIISPRAFTLFGMLVILILLFIAGHVKAADVAIPAETAFPADDALSTVAVVDHSGNLYSLWVTMKDGRVLCFDKRSPMSWQNQVEWARAHGGHVVAVTAPYTIVGGTDAAS